jgi:hypothetical protein
MEQELFQSSFMFSFETFYLNLTVMKMEWFQPNEGGTFLEDFDYILKVVKTQHSKNNWKITYNDLKGQAFVQTCHGKKNLSLHFEVGDIIKLRSIASVSVTEDKR